ncbi:DoxX family protein [Lentzea sp. PSKA42]|uniref:DoxX family protein n=1 Tax=Lentzea indica TaxID=2604800 RepID=A0ABX1FLT2_9PSEU|nr:DoxX family protein [Lentzea indica]NKE59897.1 DoxX family protein [Lentzea indica]
MQTRTTETFRPIAFWATTFVIVFELTAGSVWNLLTIEWVEVQLHHLGYPHFFSYVLGVAQAGAAVAIIAPGLRLIKEWAYAGAFFLWSGAVVSHVAVGDGLESWWVPLMFGAFAVASWMLRPADRRPGTSRRAWAVSIGLIVVLYAVSFLTLPAVEAGMHEHAVKLGWIAE